MNKIFTYILLSLVAYPMCGSDLMYLDPINIGILNTSSDEFAPSWNQYTSTLFLTSNKSGKEKLYTTTKNADGFFEAADYLDNPINKIHDNVSFINFISEDKAYFSTFLFDGVKSKLQLFYTNFKKKAWTEGFIVEEFTSEKFVGHNSISNDGNQLAFTTQSFEGDLDIMISYRLEDGTWREPIPLEIMNSTGDEITPHFASDDTLYFASNGQGGPGGYDIYFSVKSEGNWQRPSPLYEINTEYDESDVSILPNGDIVFASNRPGGKGGLDLWLANTNRVLVNKPESQPLAIDLQSYVNNIVVNNNYQYVNLPISSIFYLQDSTKELQNKFFNYKKMVDLQKITTVEESYYNSLNYIGYMMSKMKSSKLKITAVYPGQLELDNTNEKNSKYYADLNIIKVRDFLSSAFGIAESRISYDYDFYNDANRKPAILLSSNEPELFSQIEIREDNLELQQKFLPIDVKIEPQINLSNWLAIIEISDEKSIVYENNKDKDRLTIDLMKYKQQLFDSDNLNLTIRAFNFNGDSTFKTISHRIEHHYSKKPKLVKEADKYYDYHYLLSSLDTNIESNSYKSSVEKIYSSITMCKSIEITYNQNKKLAESLKSKLQSKITSNQLNVKLVKSSGIVNDKVIDDNLILVKVEKFTNRSSNN